MIRVWDEPAWVLHARDYGESSQIVELLTGHEGRVGIIARGVKRIRRGQRLEPFIPWIVSWSGHENRLPTLKSAERAGPPTNLRDHALWAAFHLHDLILRMTERFEPLVSLYSRYTGALEALGSGAPPARVVCLFERDLLTDLGYGLNLLEEAVTREPIDPSAFYDFDAWSGARRMPAGTVSGIEGRVLLDLAHGAWTDGASLQSGRRLLEGVYAAHAGGRNPGVRSWMESLLHFTRRHGA
jgi:DNA repair protein RecO (recombination protein O)